MVCMVAIRRPVAGSHYSPPPPHIFTGYFGIHFEFHVKLALTVQNQGFRIIEAITQAVHQIRTKSKEASPLLQIVVRSLSAALVLLNIVVLVVILVRRNL